MSADAETSMFLSVPDVAKLCKVSPQTVYTWIDRGLLKACRMGGVVRVPHADFQAYLKSTYTGLPADAPRTAV